ncbi:MAG: hypothetical protein JWR07_3325, partial [Nevskia sp.]|nr:hypothetical protein [Nevskia sp.]
MKSPWATLLLCLGLLGATSPHAAEPVKTCATFSR